jgi:hypothetical protein
MSILRKTLPALLAVSLIAALLATPAAAAPLGGPNDPQSAKTYDMRCEGGECTLRVDMKETPVLARIGLAAAASTALSALRARSDSPLTQVTVDVQDDLVVRLPVGQVQLPQADLEVDLGAGNSIEAVRGTAQVPFPTLGALDHMEIITPATANVGLDTGANLAHLDAPLQPDRKYLYFDFGTGFDVAAEERDGQEEFHLSVPAGRGATLVIDTEEPMVYLVGNLTLARNGQFNPVDLLSPDGPAALLPLVLPVDLESRVAVSAQLGQDVPDPGLNVGVAYVVDTPLVGDAEDGKATPLTLEGVLAIQPEGMRLTGVVDASMLPGTVFEGNVGVEAFVPFDGEWHSGYLLLQGAAAVPVAGIDADGSARLALPEDFQVEAPRVLAEAGPALAELKEQAPERARLLLTAVKDRAAPAVDAASSAAGTVGSAASSAAGAAGSAASSAAGAAGTALAEGGDWISSNARTGYTVLIQLLPQRNPEPAEVATSAESQP